MRFGLALALTATVATLVAGETSTIMYFDGEAKKDEAAASFMPLQKTGIRVSVSNHPGGPEQIRAPVDNGNLSRDVYTGTTQPAPEGHTTCFLEGISRRSKVDGRWGGKGHARSVGKHQDLLGNTAYRHRFRPGCSSDLTRASLKKSLAGREFAGEAGAQGCSENRRYS